MMTLEERYEKYKFNEECMELLSSTVKDVRDKLASTYDVASLGDSYKYTGLCDEACVMVKNMIKYAIDKKKKDDNKDDEEIGVSIKLIHGEQKHLPRIQTKYWILQHEIWGKISQFIWEIGL